MNNQCILLCVYLPIYKKNYEFYVPLNQSIEKIIQGMVYLINKELLIEKLSNKSNLLVFRKRYYILDKNKHLKDCYLFFGEQIILI